MGSVYLTVVKLRSVYCPAINYSGKPTAVRDFGQKDNYNSFLTSMLFTPSTEQRYLYKYTRFNYKTYISLYSYVIHLKIDPLFLDHRTL